MVPALLYAQCTSTLSGIVYDKDTKDALEFTHVFLVEPNIVVQCDEHGEYKIENVCDGTYTVKISHIGCLPLETKISVKGKTDKHFYLPHAANNLGEVAIYEKKLEEKTTQTKNVISETDLNKSKGESLGEVLKQVPGVTTIQTGPSISKPVIHGLHSNRVLILNNGIRQEGQQWGNEHAPEIDPFIANKITVIKGANAVRYGSDAIAGVVLVEPAELRDSAGINGELNLVGFSNNQEGVASGMVEQNMKKLNGLTWRLQGTIKKAGNSQTPTYYLKNTGYKEQNFSGSIGYNKDKYGLELFYSQFNTTIGIFSGSHIGNLTDLQKAFDRTAPIENSGFSYTIGRPYQGIEHELFKAKAYLQTGSVGKFNFVYARQYNLRYEYDKHKPLNNSLAALNLPELQYEITTHTADINWEHNSIKKVHGVIGITGMTRGNTFEGRYFIPNFHNYSGGAFLIERTKVKNTEFEAGLRYDYKTLQIFKWENNIIIKPVFNFKNASGTLGLIQSFGEHYSLNANVGTAWRAPTPNELFSDGLHHGAAAVEIGDRTLKPEKAYNSIVTISYNGLQHKKLNGELSFYYNMINNFIYLQPQQPPTLTIRGAFPTFVYKQVDAAFKGIDATLIYKLSKDLQVTGKASMLRAFNKTIGDYLIMMPSDRYQVSAGYNFKAIKKLTDMYISVSSLYVTKQWRVPVGQDYAPPPEAYMLLTIEGGIALKLKNQKINISVGVNNLLNTSYREYLNRFRYYADDIGRNISVKLKVPFAIETRKINTKN